MSVVGSNILAGASGAGGGAAASYTIERSLRFNRTDSAYLNKTYSTSATDLKKQTFSFWVKRTELSTTNYCFYGYDGASSHAMGLQFVAGTDQLSFNFGGSSGVTLRTSQVFRDPSAWLHIVLAIDTTQATSSDRVKFYINGSQVTYFAISTYPALNASCQFGLSNANNKIGALWNSTGFTSFYLAEFYFIDGQALTASDFGEYDDNNVWQPKEFGGSYITGGISGASGALPIYNTTDDLGKVKGTGLRTDANSSNLVLAVAMDGSNGGTTFTDESSSSHSITLLNTPETSTVDSRYYGSSGKFDNGDGLSFGTSNDFAFGTGDFTIEAWLKLGTDDQYTLWDSGSVNVNGHITIFGTGASMIARLKPGTDLSVTDATSGIATGQWFHLAITRESGTLKMWVNGVLKGSQANSSNVTATGGRTGTMNGYPSNYLLDGYMQDLRVYKGVAKYTADFTPPAENSNSFFLNFSDNSSNAALGDDSSGNNHDWTVNNMTARGADYAGDCVLTGTIYSGAGAISNLFDGTDTGVAPSQGSYITFTPSTAIPITSTLRVKGNVSSTSVDANFAINGSNVSTVTAGFPASGTIAGTSSTWTTISSPPSSLTSLRFGWASGGSWFSVSGIEVDGVVLTDAAFTSVDSLIDTPTNYEAASGNNGGNYCTWNPLASQGTLANGNLDLTSGASGTGAVSSFVITSGKWYAEFTNIVGYIGVQDFSKAPTYTSSASSTGSLAIAYYYTGTIYYDGGSASAPSYSTSDLIRIAVDKDANTVSFYKNNVLQQTLTMGSGNVPQIDNLVFIHNGGGAGGSGRTVTANFGQRPYQYTPPTDHLSLCTQNLSDSTITDSSTAMDALLYVGNATARSITGLDFAPDLVWIKNRSQADLHVLTDSVRGVTKQLSSSSNAAETTNADGLTAFNSDGFDLGADVAYNTNTESYVAWSWDGGTSTVTNTDGTHSAQVRANLSTGFSISTHSRTTAASISTWGHGLGAAPEFAILKPYNGAYNWFVWHKDMGNRKRIYLNSTSAGNSYSFDVWSSNSTTLGIYGTIIAGGGTALDCVTYAWAPVEGYSKFDFYEGNGNANGPFVFTGFRPKLIMTKDIDSTSNWNVYDTSRDTYNVADAKLSWNLTSAESTLAAVDILSNGFKIRTNNADMNENARTFIYAAWAENPFKTARAR